MPEISFTVSARKFIKKAKPNLKDEILRQIETIQSEPEKGNFKSGDLQGFQSKDFNFLSTAYRIIYTASSEEITVFYIGPRENAYQTLKASL